MNYLHHYFSHNEFCLFSFFVGTRDPRTSPNNVDNAGTDSPEQPCNQENPRRRQRNMKEPIQQQTK